MVKQGPQSWQERSFFSPQVTEMPELWSSSVLSIEELQTVNQSCLISAQESHLLCHFYICLGKAEHVETREEMAFPMFSGFFSLQFFEYKIYP